MLDKEGCFQDYTSSCLYQYVFWLRHAAAAAVAAAAGWLAGSQTRILCHCFLISAMIQDFANTGMNIQETL